MSRKQDYPDDIFDQTRMSFGDHIEELRSRLLKAIYGLLFFLIIGFVLDSVGEQLNRPNLGIGRPMMKVITAPVEDQAKNFYANRIEAAKQKIENLQESAPDDVKRVIGKHGYSGCVRVNRR